MTSRMIGNNCQNKIRYHVIRKMAEKCCGYLGWSNKIVKGRKPRTTKDRHYNIMFRWCVLKAVVRELLESPPFLAEATQVPSINKISGFHNFTICKM